VHITTHTGLVGFFLALSALQVSGAAVATDPATATHSTPDTVETVESRLARLTAAIRQREAVLPEGTTTPVAMLIAGGFANRSGGGGFVNSGGGGGFVNINPWRNAWVNGGSFYNYH